jgi:ParB family chromosome partitioning protein
MMPVGQLAAHPGNVRADLDLSEEFVGSIAANGVLVALRITPDGDGFRVIDGGRRLAAALQAGVGEVPFDLVAERAGDEPGQYLDMITTNSYRNPLTVLEEADALFAAKQAGATRTRLRKTTGMGPSAVNEALAAARLTVETRDQAGRAGEQLTLDQYAVLAEFQDDPKAVERLLTVARWGSMDHEAERIRQQRAELADHDQLRTELEAVGYQVADSPPGPDQLLATLLHDDQDLTPKAHATCPGRAVFFRPWDLRNPVHYCTDPAAHGHVTRYAGPAASAPGGDGEPDLGAAAEEAPADPSRRLVIEGNKAWTAATEVRRRWLATLFARRTAPRELTQFVAGQLVTMPEPVHSGLGRAHHQTLFSQVTGRSDTDWLALCETVPAGRLPLVMFAPIATAFESAMGEGEGRNTWRTGRYSPCPREQAAAYLTLLAGLGYQLSIIEQAVARQQPYTGEIPPGQAVIGQDSEPAPDADGSRPGTAEVGQPDVGQGVSGDEAAAAGPAEDGSAEAPIAA